MSWQGQCVNAARVRLCSEPRASAAPAPSPALATATAPAPAPAPARPHRRLASSALGALGGPGPDLLLPLLLDSQTTS